MNLRTKLWLLIVASTFTGICLFSIATWVTGELTNHGYTHKELNELGIELTKEAAQVPPSQVDAIFDRFAMEHPTVQLDWFDQDGSLQYASDGRMHDYDFASIAKRFLNMPANLWEDDRNITLVFDWKQDTRSQFLFMSLPSNAMQNKQFFFYVRDNLTYVQLLIPFVLFLTALYSFALFFFARINRRLGKMNKAMNAVDAQGSAITLEESSKDEIGQLTRHFNRMSKRIREQIGQIQEYETKRKALIANLSHDLRTPMTMIQGYAETLHAGVVQDEEERRKCTEIILLRSHYMDRLLQKLLDISQLDTPSERLRWAKINVSELLRKTAADYVPVLENQEFAFEVHIPEPSLLVWGDPHLIDRAVRNLLDNAMQHGGSARYLCLSLDVRETAYNISITDHGPGVSREQKPLLFERFYRGSKGREGEGLGIGLSIVKEVAEAHHGKVHISSDPLSETTFSMILPIHRQRTE